MELPPPVPADDPRLDGLRTLLAVVDRLRAPDGCPWDREQTESSMAPYVIEEGHEWLQAIEQESAGDAEAEAGDVLLSALMTCHIAAQAQRYDAGTAAARSARKAVDRHPHVFGGAEGPAAEDVLRDWEARKQEERRNKGEDPSVLAGVAASLPALMRAGRLSDRAIRAGFCWSTIEGALRKVHEELGELEEVLPEEAREAAPGTPPSEAARPEVEHELGDLLLAGSFLAVYLGLDPEALTRRALDRFESRFRIMEGNLEGKLGDHSLEALMEAWGAAKRAAHEPRS